MKSAAAALALGLVHVAPAHALELSFNAPWIVRVNPCNGRPVCAFLSIGSDVHINVTGLLDIAGPLSALDFDLDGGQSSNADLVVKSLALEGPFPTCDVAPPAADPRPSTDTWNLSGSYPPPSATGEAPGLSIDTAGFTAYWTAPLKAVAGRVVMGKNRFGGQRVSFRHNFGVVSFDQAPLGTGLVASAAFNDAQPVLRPAAGWMLLAGLGALGPARRARRT
jgi:hypothetical protein